MSLVNGKTIFRANPQGRTFRSIVYYLPVGKSLKQAKLVYKKASSTCNHSVTLSKMSCKSYIKGSKSYMKKASGYDSQHFTSTQVPNRELIA